MNIKLAFVAIVAVLIQLGLAILGSGGFGPFFSHARSSRFAWWCLSFSSRRSSRAGISAPGEREDRGNRWVFAAFGVLALLLAFVPAYTDRIGFWTIDGETTRWIGVLLLAIGGTLRLWPVFVLGHRFSGLVAIQPNHRLVTTGIYRTIRNPSYLGLFIGTLGWALAFRSLIGVMLRAFHLVRSSRAWMPRKPCCAASSARNMMAYYARTWRLVPWLY